MWGALEHEQLMLCAEMEAYLVHKRLQRTVHATAESSDEGAVMVLHSL